MIGEHDPINRSAPAAPSTDAPTGAERDGKQGAERSAGEKAHADWQSRHEPDGSKVMAGSRTIEHPIDTVDDAGGSTGGGTLYDRLSKKDQTPVEDGGSSSLA